MGNPVGLSLHRENFYAMKNPLKLFLASLMLLLPALAHADGRVIPYEKLPAEAKSFIAEYFPSAKVLQVTAEWDEYEVLLSDRVQLEFNRSGLWKKIKCKTDGVPQAVIPSRIVSYFQTHFPEYLILQIERSRWGYEVETREGLEFEFDKNCNFIRIDD